MINRLLSFACCSLLLVTGMAGNNAYADCEDCIDLTVYPVAENDVGAEWFFGALGPWHNRKTAAPPTSPDGTVLSLGPSTPLTDDSDPADPQYPLQIVPDDPPADNLARSVEKYMAYPGR